MSDLNNIFKILEKGKGILAADESIGTMTKRLKCKMFHQLQKIDYYLEKLYFFIKYG